LLWQGEVSVTLPDNSRLIFTQKLGEGFALNRVKNIKLRIKNREGGERFKPALGRSYRSLKQVLQTHAMPPWQREQLPLIFMDETLVIIPNVGVDAGFQTNSDEMGLVVEWLKSPSPAGGISNDLADVVCQPSQSLVVLSRGVGERGNGES
jgi:tRNA(Ile)-lysidine synthase